MTPIRRWSALGTCLAVVTFVRAARAQVEPIGLEFSAAPECPTPSEFARGVFGRTTRARPAVPSETSVRTFVVTVTKSGSRYVGNLVVRQADGTTSAREVTGSDCKSVSEALALATSLAIDPNASLGVAPSPDETPSDATTTPAEPKPEPVAPVKPDEPPPADAPANRWLTHLTFGPTGATAIAPRVALGGSASLAWARRTPDRVLSSFGVELTLLGSLPASTQSASSRFWFYFARPELCSFGAFAGGVALVPCLGLELGAVTGVGSDLDDPATRTRFWAAADAKLALRVDLGDAWFVEAHGGAVVPFVRYEFVFRNPDTSVHTIPALGATFGVKIGGRL